MRFIARTKLKCGSKKKNCIKFSVVYDIIIKNKPIATARLS